MRSYKVQTANGTCFVRFRKGLCYTIVDSDGNEHEVGMWSRFPNYLPKSGRFSRDRHNVFYELSPFNERSITRFRYMKDMAVTAISKTEY